MEAVRERRAGARREERRRTGDRGKPILPQRAREDVHEDAQAAEQREEEDLEELHMRRRRATTVAVNTLRWRSGRRVERGERPGRKLVRCQTCQATAKISRTQSRRSQLTQSVCSAAVARRLNAEPRPPRTLTHIPC